MSHYVLVRLLEGLAAEHSHTGCNGPGCRYCEALIDVASTVTADWVAGLARSLQVRTAQPLPVREVIEAVLAKLETPGEGVRHG